MARYLVDSGFEVIPVNPMHDEVLGLKSYKNVPDIGRSIDIVDIFRKPAAIPGAVDEAIEAGAKIVWMQEGLAHNESAKRAREKGLVVVMNKCIMKEHKKWKMRVPGFEPE